MARSSIFPRSPRQGKPLRTHNEDRPSSWCSHPSPKTQKESSASALSMGASSRTRPRARLRGLAFHWNRPLGWTVKCRWLPLTRTALRARLRCPRTRADGPRKWKGSLPRRDQHSPSLQDARRAARAVLLAKLEPKRHLDVGMQRPPQRIRTPPDWYVQLAQLSRAHRRTYVRTHNCRVPILSVLSFGFLTSMRAHPT